jgi:hypothetical protein
MGMSEFLENRFLNKEICVYAGEDVEVLTYNEAWAANKEYFRGVLKEVNNGVLVLEITGHGTVYIDAAQVKFVWEEPFNYGTAIRASLTKRPVGGNR